jgi:hypothetical protein
MQLLWMIGTIGSGMKTISAKGEGKWGMILWLVVIVVVLLFLGYGLARWRFEVLTSLYG